MTNKKYFEIVSEISAQGYVLQQVLLKLSENKDCRTPIDVLIDKATGKEDKEVKEFKKTIIATLRRIIRLKKMVNEDATKDEEFLNKVLALGK